MFIVMYINVIFVETAVLFLKKKNIEYFHCKTISNFTFHSPGKRKRSNTEFLPAKISTIAYLPLLGELPYSRKWYFPVSTPYLLFMGIEAYVTSLHFYFSF